MHFCRLFLVVGLLCGSAVAASPLDEEAQQLTRQLRMQDPYAKVMITAKWQAAQKDPHGAMRAKFIAGKQPTGYIWLRDFNNTSLCRRFRQQLHTFQAQGAQRLILDVRGNPGGQRFNAVCIAGALVGPRPILGVRGLPSLISGLGDWIDGLFDYGSETLWFQTFGPQETNMPVALIQDQETASAAEILSGALQDYERAWIVGGRSFGKGRSQECVPMKGRPELTICHTIQQFYLPKGASPEGAGVSPTPLSKSMQRCVAKDTKNTQPDRTLAYALLVLDCAGH